MNRYPAHIPKWGIDLRPIIAYGFSVLGMSDVEMARELCISRERVRQLRNKSGISLRKCAACGETTIKSSTIQICRKCQSLPPKLCVICKDRRVVKSDDDRCWKCRRLDNNRTEEGREYNKQRMRKYLKKISQDPVRKERRREQIKEWNRRSRERKNHKESVS